MSIAFDICMLVGNDVRRDPRVQKEARTLAQAGFRVGVIGVTLGETHDWQQQPDGYFVRRLTRTSETKRFVFKEHLRQHHPTIFLGVRGVWRFGQKARAYFYRSSHHPVLVPAAHRDMAFQIANHPELSERLALVAAESRAKVIHSHDLDMLQAGVWAASRLDAPTIFDAHEIYWQQHPDNEALPQWVDYFRRQEEEHIRHAYAVVTVCTSIAQFFSERYNMASPLVVRNAIEGSPTAATPAAGNEPPQVLFHGGFAAHRGLEELLTAFKTMRNARLVLRGFGSLEEELRKRVQREHLEDRVVFVPPVPMHETVAAARTADIGIIPYKPVCLNNRYSTPNKLFEYMHAGLAVAASDLPEIRRIIDAENIGACFDPFDPQSICNAIHELVADRQKLTAMRQRSIDSARLRHHWMFDAQHLVTMYQKLLK